MALLPGDAVAVRDRPWAASCYDSPEQPISVYVDVTTPAVWDGPQVTMVDLARRTADELMTTAARGLEPFGASGHRWLSRLAASPP